MDRHFPVIIILEFLFYFCTTRIRVDWVRVMLILMTKFFKITNWFKVAVEASAILKIDIRLGIQLNTFWSIFLQLTSLFRKIWIECFFLFSLDSLTGLLRLVLTREKFKNKPSQILVVLFLYCDIFLIIFTHEMY